MAGKKIAEKNSVKIADNLSAMLTFWNKQEVCQFANHASHEWFQHLTNEITGISLEQLLGSTYKKHKPYIKKVLTGIAQTFESELEMPDGKIRYLIVSYYPEKKGNTVVGFFAHMVDVSVMKNLEEKLRKSKSRFKKIVENAPDAIVLVTTTGKIKRINAQCESLFGYTKQELAGKPIEILIPERFRHDHQKARDLFGTAPHVRPMAEGYSLFALRKNGEEFPVEISLSPLELRDEVLISASIRDVSWKTEKQNQLIQSMEIINKQNKHLLNFAHIISHNLKTHSVNLASVLSLLAEATSEDEKKKMMDFLQSVSSGFSDTVNNLTDISNIDADSRKERIVLNLAQYVQKCLDTLDINIKSCDAQIINHVDAQIDVQHNPVYLESIIQNFLTNAIKYRDADRPLIIKLDAYKKDNEVILRIEDNGLGINLEKHGKKLFGIYQTFHGNPDAKGVGLFITKYQVEELGGHITVMSKEGVGTVFKIYFRNK